MCGCTQTYTCGYHEERRREEQDALVYALAIIEELREGGAL